jgi:hypothetical protein
MPSRAPATVTTPAKTSTSMNIEVLDTDDNVIPSLYAASKDSMDVLLSEETGYAD